MASQVSMGSPKMGRKQVPSAIQVDGNADDDKTPRMAPKPLNPKPAVPIPAHARNHTKHTAKDIDDAQQDSNRSVTTILSQLRINDARKPSSIHGSLKQQDSLEKVIANLKDQHNTLKKQQMDLREDSDTTSYRDHDRSSGSELFTPATETFATELHTTDDHQTVRGTAEMVRIKEELETARSVINRQELELAETRNLRHTMEQAVGPASEADYPVHADKPRLAPIQTQNNFNVSARPFTSQAESSWHMLDDGKADLATTLVNPSMGRSRNWSHNQAGYQGLQYAPNRESRANSLGYGSTYNPQTSPIDVNFTNNRTFSSGAVPVHVPYGIEERLMGGMNTDGPYAGLRRNGNQFRTGSTLSGPLSPITPVSPYGQTLVDPNVLGPAGLGQYGYLDRGFGGQTSPITGQFPTGAAHMFPGDLALPGNCATGQSYVMPAEPMNYRRLLDKSVSCDWKYIVDKIVCNNDQQASIFLQQKLKVGTAEQKYEIVESIVNQAYPLMINRFGNFLVQRCFEHGTPEQVVAIANAIHGNVISLSMDPFGCHVVQKAFDSVPEDHKADMVRELLRRIPDTVIHRYACHVWQKLFELRWSGEPPQIMVKVNEALHGMWHEVALGETGSLVVQNIFENCVEEEKRPAIEEVISNIDLIAHGQFGNWCIQHLCEHGSPPDKRRVIDHILTNAYNYSIDQFASKVVEKCLKIGGPEFLERYLGVITTARPDRPRIPLIDIAGDQYGNYLIQWILMNTHQHQREQVAIHIRKHMVSLRGSKFGSRVAMLCSNPASITRPGTASALVNPYAPPTQQRMGARFR